MFETEVAKGAAWLDKVRPGWYKSIDIGGLDLKYCDTCVLGQIFGESTSDTLNNGDKDFSISHGFNLAQEYERHFLIFKKEKPQRWKALSGAWIHEVLRRKSVENLTDSACSARPVVRPK